MTEHTLTVDETMDRTDAAGDPSSSPGQDTEPKTAAATDLSGFTAGAEAPHDLYVIHGWYKNELEADGVTLTPVERSYDTDRYATELAPGERGNLLVGAGDTVSDEVAALLAR